MVFSAKSSTNNDGWGMGLLLILFHHHPHYNNNNNNNIFTRNKKPSLFSLPSSKSFNNLLSSKTQYTLYSIIIIILLFTTLLIFTLPTYEHASILHHNLNNPPRRILQEGKIPRNTLQRFSLSTVFSVNSRGSESKFTHIGQPALQGMGTLFLRGSKAMNDLIVGHVNEDTSEIELRTFLRVIYYSGLLSRCDFVFIFSSPVKFGHVVKSECDSFVRHVQLGRGLSEFGSELNRYLKEVGEGEKESMWGKKKGNSSELTRTSYGSVVGFEVSELDPEGSLSGFLDHVPMSLRRWAGYPMLLGRVRRNFKHMMLIDVKRVLILSDPFSRVRNRSSESLFVWSNPDAEVIRHHGRRNSGKTRDPDPKVQTQVHPGIIVGGSRGVRRFANAALTEIVRNVIEHKGKGKNSVKVTESGLVNQLVHSGHLLKNIDLITPNEPIPELSSLNGFNSGDSSSRFLKLSDNFEVVQHEHNGDVSVDINNAIMKEICASHRLYSSVYSDCLASQ